MTIQCQYCNTAATLVSSFTFYGRDYGTNLWVCYPCEAYVGTRGNTATPLGTLAKKELRELRKQTHQLIDSYWKTGRMTRTMMYQKIQTIMGLSEEDAHVGKFNEEQCKELMRKVLNGALEGTRVKNA